MSVRGTALEHEWGDYIDYYVYDPKGFARSPGMIGSGVSDYGIKQRN